MIVTHEVGVPNLHYLYNIYRDGWHWRNHLGGSNKTVQNPRQYTWKWSIREVSTFLESWKLVAPHLGLSKGEIEAIDRDGKTEEEKRLLMLQRWKQALVFKATYKKLINALLSVRRADVAVKVCQVVSLALANQSPLPTVGTHVEGQY